MVRPGSPARYKRVPPNEPTTSAIAILHQAAQVIDGQRGPPARFHARRPTGNAATLAIAIVIRPQIMLHDSWSVAQTRK